MDIKTPRSARPGRGLGLSLIELLISLAVVAIVAAVAYPSYDEHVRKGRRASAQAFITDLASRQQQHLITARTYATGADALTTLGVAVPADVSRFYTIAVQDSGTGVVPGFTVLGTPVAGTSQVRDGNLTLDNLGARTRGGVAGW